MYLGILFAAAFCSIVFVLTRKDLAFICAFAYWFAFGMLHMDVDNTTAIIIGSVIDFGVLVAAAGVRNSAHQKLSIAIMSLCILSLITNGLNLIHFGEYLVYAGYAIQAATCLSLIVFDGRREWLSDYVRGCSDIAGSMSNASRRHNHWR